MEKNSDKWVIQLRKGVFELAILALINQRPMYGYELTSGLKSLPLFDLTDGAIYPILKRLSQDSWIVSYWVESEGGPKRKYYKITEEGQKILEKRWTYYEAIYSDLEKMVKGGSEL
ncbi:PadR family transcriptional regulator [Priestia megaterium]